MRIVTLILAVCGVTVCGVWLAATAVWATDWITAPSTYTHDPRTGQRVTQYAPHEPAYSPDRGNLVRSGYRQTRSSLQVGSSADHMHVVEEWGRPVRPYGEWQHPYRPHSVPYHLWGPPLAGWNGPRISPWGLGPRFSPYGLGPAPGLPGPWQQPPPAQPSQQPAEP